MQFQPQTSSRVELSPLDGTSVQTEQVAAGGNYTTIPLRSLAHSPHRPTTDSGVGSCSQVEDNHSEGVAVKVSLDEQEAALKETTECKTSTPEFNTCNTVHKPVLAAYVTLNSVPFNMA